MNRNRQSRWIDELIWTLPLLIFFGSLWLAIAHPHP